MTPQNTSITDTKPIIHRVRSASLEDVNHIHELIREYAEMGDLLPRSIEDIKSAIDYFSVIQQNNELLVCAALETFTDELGEIRSLVVNKAHARQRLGSIMVQHIIEQARNRGLSRLMALAYAPEFFHTLGFKTIDKHQLPEKVWGVCINCYKFKHCDEIAVILNL